MYFSILHLAFIGIGLLCAAFGISLVATKDSGGYWFIFVGIVVVLLITIIVVYTGNYIVSGTICQKEIVGEYTNIKIDNNWYRMQSYKDYLDVYVGDNVTVDVVESPAFFSKETYIMKILDVPTHTGECGGLTTCNCNCSFVKGV